MGSKNTLLHVQVAHSQQIFCFNENQSNPDSGSVLCWLQQCSTGSSWCPETGRGSCSMIWRLRPLDSISRSSWTWSSGWSRTSSSAGSTSNRWTELVDACQRFELICRQEERNIYVFTKVGQGYLSRYVTTLTQLFITFFFVFCFNLFYFFLPVSI